MADAEGVDPDAIADAVESCTLPKPQWTHAAHLAAGLAWVRRLGLEAAVPHARACIRRYNESTGVANTDDHGYHETITRFFLTLLAGHAAAGSTMSDVLADPDLSVAAPLRHWQRETLFSVRARRGWVPPDKVGLPV
jgi:hypothetical protein